MSMKDCYGILDRVFPMGEQGLREVPEACFACPERTACMRVAMRTKQGIAMQEDALDRSPASGLRGRILRWSRKKELERMARGRKKGRPL
ncbi:MAG: hypothetical protein K9M82_05175 [Deltaproteobacteria bacterium]|nr:hypothetical protein [Deltaproteobacteria bacterium]